MSLTAGVIVPSWRYWLNPVKLQPLWELYYATLISDRVPGAIVDVLDMRGEQAFTAETLPERDAYFYWLMKSADAFEVYETVRVLRRRYPQSVHLAGGNHVDHLQGDCAAVFDACFTGTAEETIAGAFAGLPAGPLERVYHADSRFPFLDYPHARRDFLPPERVVNNDHFSQYGGVPGTGVYFSRGCGFKCRFCVYNNPPAFEYRKPEQITAEIEYLKREYGVQGLNLRDEVAVPVNPKAARAYLEAIGAGGVIWRGQTVPFGSEEMVALAAASGCKELALGVESVDSDLVLEIANKPLKSVAACRAYIEMLKKHGIRVKVCLVLGLPGESRQIVDRTIRFLEEVRPDYVAVSGFAPVPGSPFYNDPQKYGIKRIDDDLSRHAHLVYRFGDDEDVGLPFEYEAETPWGKSFTRDEIIGNIKTVQQWLREQSMSY
jgi:radical SAM superfamily enzyme YgiQ (UPF0313 family)